MTDLRALLDDFEATLAEDNELTVDQLRARSWYSARPINALRAVLDLHRQHDALPATCVECSEREDTYDDIPWPCPTVQAITTALEAP
jgi:hypothetical protein